MMKPVEIFSGNRLDEHCSLTVSSGAQNAAALYDQNPRTQWKSGVSGGTETVSVAFRTSGGSSITREFDTIMLLNHNIADMTARHLTSGGEQAALAGAELSGNAEEDSIIELAAPLASSAISLDLSETISPSSAKAIGELKICRKIFTLGNALCSFARTDKTRQGYYYTSGGSLVAWREYSKAAGTFTADNLSHSDRNTLLGAVRDNDFLTFVMHRDMDAREVYEFAVIAPVTEKLDRRSGLYSLSLEVAER